MTSPDLTNAVWRKSTRSNSTGTACVEVAFVEDVIAVRDSKDKTGPALVFGAREWDAFLAGVKGGAFA